MIKDSEGLRLSAYGDTAGVSTIGWGHASKNPRFVKGVLNGAYYEGITVPDLTITLTEAMRLFEEDVADFELQLSQNLNLPVGIDLAQCQVDALVEFLFQYGLGHFSGSTLQGMIQKNPNNLGDDHQGILHEFSRWNKVKGVREEAIYRRALRRACLYAGVPIPAKLWSENGIPFALLLDGNIDHSVTPTAFQIVEQSRKASTKPKFEPEYPRKAEPTIIETPAVEISPPVVAKAEPPIQQPPSPGGSADPSKEPADDKPLSPNDGPKAAEREPAPSSVKVPAPPVPPPPKPPAPPPPIGQQTSAVNSANNSQDWSQGAKNMLLSRRFYGLALVMFGRLWMMKTGSGALLAGVSDPLVTEMFSGFAVMVAGELIGWWGRAKATRPLK